MNGLPQMDSAAGTLLGISASLFLHSAVSGWSQSPSPQRVQGELVVPWGAGELTGSPWDSRGKLKALDP